MPTSSPDHDYPCAEVVPSAPVGKRVAEALRPPGPTRRAGITEASEA